MKIELKNKDIVFAKGGSVQANIDGNVFVGGTRVSPASSNGHYFSGKNIKKSPITISAATKLLEYIQNNEVAFYMAQDCMYVEFTANSCIHHILVFSDGTAKMEEADFKCFNHLLLVSLAYALMKNPDIAKMVLDFVTGLTTPDLVYLFTDEFYHAHYKDVITVETNDTTLPHELEAGFRSGFFKPNVKIGFYKSAYETFCNQEAEEESEQTPKKTKSHSEEEEEMLWEDIKKGKYVLDYQFPEQLQGYIQPISFLENYVPTKQFFNVFKFMRRRLTSALNRIKEAEKTFETKTSNILNNKGLSEEEKILALGEVEKDIVLASKQDAINLFFHGVAGTGKTYMAYALCAAFGLPSPFENCSDGTEEDTFEGITKVIEGQLKEIDTPTMQIAEFGGCCIEEEFDLQKAGVIKGSFNQLIEYPYKAKKSGYKPVFRHPLAVYIATFNVDEENGCTRIEPALSSRFLSVKFEDPTDDDFIKFISASGIKKKTAKYVLKQYQKVHDLLESPDISGEDCKPYIVPRLCIECATLIEKDNIDCATAIQWTFINKIAETRPSVAELVWNTMEMDFQEL